MDETKTVYRRMRNLPDYIRKDGSISSALFSDRNGVSVDIDAGRSLEDIIKDEERLHQSYHPGMSQDEMIRTKRALKAIIAVEREECESKSIVIQPEPIREENEYHAILRRDDGTLQLTHGQCKYLSNKCRYVKKYF
ncbi:hypothetical protein ADH76_29750 [Enterocloster clostridioformis]|nr:hypothetical protein A4V08_04495 [Lachnoclostridium sp. YL32]OXE63522.1 hypothetical protein ADH76_29750 [Enterocloster clostridioformis]QQR00039.1 hypothetical protein I5Q83_30130 [Enterocloster clostridioformis]